MCKKHSSARFCKKILCTFKVHTKTRDNKKFHQKILIGLKVIDKYKLFKIEGFFKKLFCDYFENKAETKKVNGGNLDY